MSLKKTLAAVVALSGVPATALAITVVAPHEGTVISTTYTPSGTMHNALDIASRKACGSVSLDAPLQGAFAWNLSVRTTGKVCYGNGSGNQNEAKHVFADGQTFRVWNLLYVAGVTQDKTCDRCRLGNEGGAGNVTEPHTHLSLDRYGSPNTSWYAGTTKGEYVDRGEVIGHF